mmetsp:Transcript_34674/g.80934  ORF Transcript_34674/g.80934 Transcript_34674/m.80934 type:complete len:314 (-) Transcript_34674:379-1320(-)
MEAKVQSYLACRKELLDFIDQQNCAPILIRLAWHDSGNYDKRIAAWPERGGANSSIVHDPEINYGANAGLKKAVGYLQSFKTKYPSISWADLIQMASACAIEACGGPQIPMKYGRVDVQDGSACPGTTSRGTADNAGLPDAKPPFGCGAPDPATHLRNIFYRMGFDDEGIVALSGAHTVGRAFKERSGTVDNGYGDATAAQYTKSTSIARKDGKTGVGMSGGKSWTKNWLTFDNSYFQTVVGSDPELIKFPTDAVLAQDPSFRLFAEKFAASNDVFHQVYAKTHKKLSELGSKFEPAQGFELPLQQPPPPAKL